MFLFLEIQSAYSFYPQNSLELFDEIFWSSFDRNILALLTMLETWNISTDV